MAKIQKYINYIKEAFLNPIHLIGLSVATIGIVLLVFLLPLLVPGVNFLPLLLLLGGLEMLYLGVMSKNKRFIRAINAKYTKEIEEYHKSKAITDYYNGLTAPRQRRFEFFKEKLDEIRANYKNIHRDHPQIVNNYLEKINNLQLTYSRLLFMQDKLPAYLNKENPDQIRKEIEVLKKSMAEDSGKLRQIKAKRIQLMEKRIEAFGKAKENGKIIGAQLQTIEEMVQYIKDQPVALKSTDEDTVMIDNILFETEQMQNTISDIESIMSSGLETDTYFDSTPAFEAPMSGSALTEDSYGDLNLDDFDMSSEDKVAE
ncbi:MAG: hypothetical protein H6581_11280 [Bacteroidia bacterium]|nr:hypothetical protein [Bacteroidia bacterium]